MEAGFSQIQSHIHTVHTYVTMSSILAGIHRQYSFLIHIPKQELYHINMV